MPLEDASLSNILKTDDDYDALSDEQRRAVQARRSLATTMGFTALDGLPMGHRCGVLDPGVVLYLMVEKGMDAINAANNVSSLAIAAR